MKRRLGEDVTDITAWMSLEISDFLHSDFKNSDFKNVWMNWKVSDDVKNVLKFNNLSGYFKRSLDENVFG